MSEAPYVPFYTSDFLAGTSGMTAATKGVYITLLCLMYEAEAPLPQSWATLARRCGCTLSAFKKAIEALEDDGKITVEDGEIWSPKCEKHIKQRGERRNSAKAAAEKRWQKDKQKQRKGDASASPAQCQPEPEPDIKEKPNGFQKAAPSLPLEDPPPKPRRRAVSLPEGWVPSERNITDAKDRQFTAEEIDHEADRFRDYHAARGTTFKDWDAAWRTWLGNARKFQGGGVARPSGAFGRGSGGSIASIVARRRVAGQV